MGTSQSDAPLNFWEERPKLKTERNPSTINTVPKIVCGAVLILNIETYKSTVICKNIDMIE
jgi:hypothetical protein